MTAYESLAVCVFAVAVTLYAVIAALAELAHDLEQQRYCWRRLLKKNPNILAEWDPNEAPK